MVMSKYEQKPHKINVIFLLGQTGFCFAVVHTQDITIFSNALILQARKTHENR